MPHDVFEEDEGIQLSQLPPSVVNATGVGAGQVPVANGANGVAWGPIQTTEPLTPVNVTSASSPYAAQAGQILLVNTTSGPVTINLPASTGQNDQSQISTLLVSGSSAVTVQTASGDTFADGTTAKQVLGSGNGFIAQLSKAAALWVPLLSSTVANFEGMFGDGTNGAAVLDGTTTVQWATLSGSVYTMNRNCYCTNLTINAGVTLQPNGFIIFCAGSLVNNGTISCDGVTATSSTAVTTGTGGNATTGPSSTSGAGTTGVGGNSSGIGGMGFSHSASGGAGASGAGGAGSYTVAANYGQIRTPQSILAGVYATSGALNAHRGACSGGGGGGDGTNKGGAGGAGALMMVVFAWQIINAGTLSAKGGDGAPGQGGNTGGGGGGGGGLIVSYTLLPMVNTGTIVCTSGNPGAGAGTGSAGGAPGLAGNTYEIVLV